MKKFLTAVALSLAIVTSGCSTLQVFQEVSQAQVPASVVIPAANAFNILKQGATNYGRYCIKEKMAPAICSADNRRLVIKAVRVGTGARNKLETSIETGQPALGSVYNLLIGAVNDLKASPASSPTFSTGS